MTGYPWCIAASPLLPPAAIVLTEALTAVHLQEGYSSTVESIGLLVVLISVVVNDVEELELVDSLGGGDDAEPVTELHLLEELLGAKCQIELVSGYLIHEILLPSGPGIALQVLQVAAGQLVVGNDLDLSVTLLGDLDLVAEVANTALNLDLLVQELLEGGDIEDLVGGRLGGVDDELERQAQVSNSY